MSLFKRASCAPHMGDNPEKTYDSNGKLCGALSSEDKMYIAIAGGFCGIVIIGLGITYLIRRRRARRSNQEETQDMQSAYNAPLLGWGSQHLRRNHNPHLDLSPMSSPTMSSPDPSMPGSPYSPNPEKFHFPILSADGHLLPPAPASAARSAHLISPVLSERPLPSPPMEQASSFSLRPISPGSTGSHGSSGSYGYAQIGKDGPEVVGLWPDQGYGESDIGQANVYLPVRSSRLSTIMGSPASVAVPQLSPGLGYAQPQSATVYSAPSYTYNERGALVRDYR